MKVSARLLASISTVLALAEILVSAALANVSRSDPGIDLVTRNKALLNAPAAGGGGGGTNWAAIIGGAAGVAAIVIVAVAVLTTMRKHRWPHRPVHMH